MSNPRVRIAIAVAAAVFLLVLVLRACGGEESSADQSPATSTPTAQPAPVIRSDDAPDAGGSSSDEPVVVPSDAAPAPPPRRAPRPADKPPAKKRVATFPGGIERAASRVSWPDARRVAAAAATGGEIVATLYGRNVSATVRALDPIMGEGALARVRARLAEDPPPAGTPIPKVRIIAMALENDPATGARVARILMDDPENANSGLQTVVLEFAPSTPEIIDWRME